MLRCDFCRVTATYAVDNLREVYGADANITQLPAALLPCPSKRDTAGRRVPPARVHHQRREQRPAGEAAVASRSRFAERSYASAGVPSPFPNPVAPFEFYGGPFSLCRKSEQTDGDYDFEVPTPNGSTLRAVMVTPDEMRLFALECLRWSEETEMPAIATL